MPQESLCAGWGVFFGLNTAKLPEINAHMYSCCTHVSQVLVKPSDSNTESLHLLVLAPYITYNCGF